MRRAKGGREDPTGSFFPSEELEWMSLQAQPPRAKLCVRNGERSLMERGSAFVQCP